MDPPLQLRLVGGLLLVGDPAQPDDDLCSEPREGMEFDSYEEAFAFYIAYGRRKGFRASTKSSRRSKKDKEYVEAKLVCSRSGTKVEKPHALYRRHSFKTGCKAAMHVKKREEDNKWFVYHFVREHNHELFRGNPCLFRPQAMADATVPTGCGDRALYSVAAGAKRSRVLAEMGQKGGGGVSAGRVEEGLGNVLESGRRFSLETGDMQVLFSFFARMQLVSPGFFYTVDLDDQEHVRNIFWVDSKGRHDYISFGDAVSVDTVYITSKCKVSLAAVFGVNHHGQQLLFGCALLSDETATTFMWLMRLWLKAMGGKAPDMIITDQDEALKAAIKHVFPNSKHRFCIWNIKKKIPEMLGHVAHQQKNFIKEFNRCVYKPCTDKEFKTGWEEMIVKFQLQESKWLQTLYENREHWVPVYLKDTLSMGMSSSERSENVNLLFDKHVSRKSTIKELVGRYEDAWNERCEKEGKANSESSRTKPSLKSPSPYELQASVVYTRYMFEKFQMEVMGTRACHVFRENEDGQTITFCVRDLEQEDEFKVIWNGAETKISCSCHSFEFNGYLCRHAIIALQFSGVPRLPSSYILKRWTKDAKNCLTLSQEPSAAMSRSQRFADLCQRVIILANEACLSQENYNTTLLALEEIMGKCVNVIDSHTYGGNSTCLNKEYLS